MMIHTHKQVYNIHPFKFKLTASDCIYKKYSFLKCNVTTLKYIYNYIIYNNLYIKENHAKIVDDFNNKDLLLI